MSIFYPRCGCVSESFDVRQLVIKIISSVNDSTHAATAAYRQNYRDLDIEELKNRVKDKLKGKKFLLVLDGMWNEHYDQWAKVRDLVRVGAAGSKILVTTSSHSVASMMGTISSHILECISMENSLSLFYQMGI